MQFLEKKGLSISYQVSSLYVLNRKWYEFWKDKYISIRERYPNGTLSKNETSIDNIILEGKKLSLEDRISNLEELLGE